jgi:hypothetical protein
MKESKVVTLGTMPDGYSVQSRLIAKRIHIDKVSLRDVAKEFGVSYQRVSTIKRESQRIATEPVDKFKILFNNILMVCKLPRTLEGQIRKAIEACGVKLK